MSDFNILSKFMLSNTLIVVKVHPINFPFRIQIHAKDSINELKTLSF
jgi:hypothetical protein